MQPQAVPYARQALPVDGARIAAPTRHLGVTLAIILSIGATACSRTHRYESAVQVVRKEIVEQGPDGATMQIDFELEWDACPGDQFQVIRGGRAFAECTENYAVGDELPVYVRHWWDDAGFYRWDIERLGDCWRTIEPASLGSLPNASSTVSGWPSPSVSVAKPR